MTDPLAALTGAGVSIWLDDLSRGRRASGSLAELVARDHVAGVTAVSRAHAEAGARLSWPVSAASAPTSACITCASIRPGGPAT